jgi:hypothetical protein
VKDTPEHVAEILRDRLRKMTPSERVEEGARASKLAREFIRAGIRMRHPDYSTDDVEEVLARLLWGDDLYRKAKPGRPLLDP